LKLEGAIAYSYFYIMNSNSFVRFLTKPFGYSIFTALLLFCFLFLYRAFGIETQSSASGHGLLSRSFVYTICFWLNIYLWDSLLLNRSLAIRRLVEALTSIFLMFLLLNYFWLGRDWQASSLLSMSLDMALFWLILLGFESLVGSLHKVSETKEGSSSIIPNTMPASGVDNRILLGEEGTRRALYIEPEKILYAKSDANYVDLYLDRGVGTEKEVFRQSLKTWEQTYPQHFLRVHRQYLVSKLAIEEVYWHSKDSYIRLKSGDKIKVGRTYQDGLRQEWESLHS